MNWKNFVSVFDISNPDSGNSETFLFLAILVFGLNYPLLKFLLTDIPALFLNAIRFTAAIFVLGIIYRAQLSRSMKHLKQSWILLTSLALIGYFFSPMLLLYGMEYSTATNAALILAGAPIWTAILSWFLRTDNIQLMGWIGLILSSVGLIFVVVFAGSIETNVTDTTFGNMLLIGDSVLWGTYVALQKNLLDRLGSVEASFWSLVIVLPLFYIVSYESIDTAVLLNFSPVTWIGILFSGIFSMGFANIWWNTSIRNLGPTTVSIYGNGIPLVGVLLSWLWLGELLTIFQVLGGFLLLVGVWLARQDRIQRGIRKIGLPES